MSVGINLNPNNACNFRCVYCQVPDLIFGKGPTLDLELLEAELHGLLQQITHGDFMQRCVPEGARKLKDIAFSGNGEPTSSPQFRQAVDLVGRVVTEAGLLGQIELVLITNGSLTDRPSVEAGIAALRPLGGKVWFKLDSATQQGALKVNDSRGSVEQRLSRLARVADVCPTWVQTCMFARLGEPPAEGERETYLQALRALVTRGVPLEGVLLYSLARPSKQPEASELTSLTGEWLEQFAQQIREVGLAVVVTP